LLYYIHGYGSTPTSTKAKLFQTKLNARAIDYHPDKSRQIDIELAQHRLISSIQGDGNPMLIGSSFGGFLGAKVALECSKVRKLVLLNPLIIPPRASIGRLRGIPKRTLAQMRGNSLFKNRIEAETTILMATMDRLIPPEWILEFAMAQETTVRFLRDDHSFSNSLTALPKIISEILL